MLLAKERDPTFVEVQEPDASEVTELVIATDSGRGTAENMS
jgi:hypothetical protein